MTKRKKAYKGKTNGYKLDSIPKELKENEKILLQIKELLLEKESKQEKVIGVKGTLLEKEDKQEQVTEVQRSSKKKVISETNKKLAFIWFNLFVFVSLAFCNISFIMNIVFNKFNVFKPYKMDLNQDIFYSLLSIVILFIIDYFVICLANFLIKKIAFKEIKLNQSDFEPYILIISTLLLVVTTVNLTNTNINEYTGNAVVYKMDSEGELEKDDKGDPKIIGTGRSIKEIVYIPVFEESEKKKSLKKLNITKLKNNIILNL